MTNAIYLNYDSVELSSVLNNCLFVSVILFSFPTSELKKVACARHKESHVSVATKCRSIMNDPPYRCVLPLQLFFTFTLPSSGLCNNLFRWTSPLSLAIRFACSFAWEAGSQDNNSPTVTELITAITVLSSMLRHTHIFPKHLKCLEGSFIQNTIKHYQTSGVKLCLPALPTWSYFQYLRSFAIMLPHVLCL